MEAKRFYVTCPGCAAELVLDASTGELLSHREPNRPPAGGRDFDDLFRELDESKARAEHLFEREKHAMKDRARLLDAKFEEALKQAEESDDPHPPRRPFDFD